jgi:adenine deaminase
MLAEDISKTGHMNDIIRRTIHQGVNSVEAIQMATINPATWLGLHDIGVLAPGKLADIAVVEGKLEDMEVSEVFLGGRLIARNRKLLVDLPKYQYPASVKNSIRRGCIISDDLKIKAEGPLVKVNCIGLILDQNLTDAVVSEMKVENGYVKPDLENDLLPMANVCRYGQSNIGKTFVKGFKMQFGAIAESVAHDTHNIVVFGTNYEDMAKAVNRVIDLQGGLVLVKNTEVIGELPLPVAGLITDELSADEVTNRMAELSRLAADVLVCKAHAPFMHLAFLSLTTSPEWKLTDKGVVDASNYRVIPVIAEAGK